MKKARVIELFANIRSTMVSFFSITMFVALGAALFLGIRWAVDSLRGATDAAFVQNSFHDFDVSFPYGLDEQDIAAIEAVDGVGSVTPGYVAYVRNMIGDTSLSVSVRSLTDGVDVCGLVEGRLPAVADEVALSTAYADQYGIAIGDTFALVGDDPDAEGSGMAYLNTSAFEVVGLVSNPTYLSAATGTLGPAQDGSSLRGFAYVTQDAFKADAFQGRWPCAYVRATTLDGVDTFSDEYRAEASRIKAELVSIGEPRAEARYDAIRAEADAQIAEGQSKIDEGEKLLEDAHEQIAQGETALTDGEKEIASATTQLETGEQTYEQTKEQGETMLGTMRESLAKLQSAYDAANEALDANLARVSALRWEVANVADEINYFSLVVNDKIGYFEKLDEELTGGKITQEEYSEAQRQTSEEINSLIEAARERIKANFPAIAERFPELLSFPLVTVDVPSWIATARGKLGEYTGVVSGANKMLADAEADLSRVQGEADSLKSQLDNGWQQYYDADARFQQQLAEAREKLEDGRRQIDEGKDTIAEKSAEIEEGKKTVEEKSAELEQGKEQLEEARAQVDKIIPMSWVVSDRFTTGGMVVMSSVITLTENVRTVMASLFVIVGLLVCYSAISRIVHEQVTQIGAKKSLGMRTGEIMAGYLAYTALAVVIGMVAGVIIGRFVVEQILFTSLSANFIIPEVTRAVGVVDTLAFGAFELVLLLGITFFVCRSVLKRSAIDLLAGEQTASAHQRFYERWGIWRKLPLFTQTLINNCVNDPRRVFATIVGVASCTALIVTAITMDGNIRDSLTSHFGLIYEFDATVTYKPEMEDADEKIALELDAMGCTFAQCMKTMLILDDEDDPGYVTIYVPKDEEQFSKLVHMYVAESDGVATTQGALFIEAFKDHRDVRVGDIVPMHSITGEKYYLKASGFYIFYLPYASAIMSPAYYRELFGKEPAYNSFIVTEAEGGIDAMAERLESLPGYAGIASEHTSVEAIIKMFTGLTGTVVIVYIALAAVMAVIVLLNLNYMFIDEKKKELIVLMINGFSERQAKAYIYRDAIVMTILGIAAGIALGVVMGSLTVQSVEWSSISFMKTPNLTAIAAGAGLSALFSVVVMLIALRRIPRFKLTDISRF